MIFFRMVLALVHEGKMEVEEYHGYLFICIVYCSLPIVLYHLIPILTLLFTFWELFFFHVFLLFMRKDFFKE